MKEKKMSRIKNPWLLTTAMMTATSAILLGCTMPNAGVDEPSPEPTAGKLLTLSGDGSAGSQNRTSSDAAVAEGMPATEDMLWWEPVNYIYLPDESLPRDTSVGDGYQIVLDKDAKEIMSILARTFKMNSAEVINDPYGFDETFYILGDWENYQRPVLSYSHSGNGYWNYSNPEAYEEPNYPETEACYIAGRGSTGSDSSEGSEDIVADETDDLNIVCETREWEVTPPADLPSAEEAERIAKELFTPLYGKDIDITVEANEWSVSASGSTLVDGKYEAGLSFGIGWFGEDISYAYGTNASWKKVADLPLVSAYDAAKRASDYRWWGWDSSAPAIAVDVPMARGEARTEPTDMGVSSEIEEESPTREPEPPVDPLPEPEMPEIKDVDVYLVNPTATMLTVWADNGDVWLLPGFTFETGEDLPWMRVSIVSVDDSLINLG